MKNLLYILILGSLVAIVAQLMQLAQGPTVTNLYIDLAGYLLFAVGIWGLHAQQTKQPIPRYKNTFSIIGTALLSLGGLALMVLSTQLVQAIQINQLGDYVDMPYYVASGVTFAVGAIFFAVSILRINYFPTWTALLLILLPIVSIVVEVTRSASEIRYVSDLILAAVFIYLSFMALKKE